MAFGSANLGFVAASRMVALLALLPYFVFVLLIGAVNLWVNFSPALYIALRARHAHRRHGPVLKAYLWRSRERPREFLLPPPRRQAERDGP